MSEESNQQVATGFSGKLAKPPWGYRQWMLTGNPAIFFDHLANRFGDFVHYRGAFNFYLINHPDLIKTVLQQTNKSFDKNTPIYRRFANAFGNGLVVSEDNQWRCQRKLMQPMFGHRAIEQFFPVMIESTNEMLARWQARPNQDASFDIAPEMSRLTLEIVGRTLFRDNFGSVSDKIREWTHTIDTYSAKPPIPIIRDFWFPSGRNRRLKRTLREFHGFIQKMIDERLTTKQKDDLLGILLRAQDPESGQAMSHPQIADEVLGMIVGGHETSSSALTWAWYELAQHPETLTQVLEEIDQVIGSGPLEIEKIKELSFTRMVLDEVLRMHPPFWFENRNVRQKTKLAGVDLPVGSIIVMSRYSLHRHSEYWRDPDQFNPDRFRPKHEENPRSSYAYIPFGGGPRICIGTHFAMMEMLVIMALIGRRYKIELSCEDRHEMSAATTMTPKYGVQVLARPRAS